MHFDEALPVRGESGRTRDVTVELLVIVFEALDECHGEGQFLVSRECAFQPSPTHRRDVYVQRRGADVVVAKHESESGETPHHGVRVVQMLP